MTNTDLNKLTSSTTKVKAKLDVESTSNLHDRIEDIWSKHHPDLYHPKHCYE